MSKHGNKQYDRSKQYEVTKQVSKIDINASPIVSVIVKYDVPHVVLPDIPVIQRPFSMVNTVDRVKAQLQQSLDVVNSLKEFYNLDIARDHMASYAIIIPGNGIHQSRRLDNNLVSHPQVSYVEVVLDVTKAIIRCNHFRHADDVNAQTIKDFESGAAFKKYHDENKALKDQVTHLDKLLVEKNARNTQELRRKEDVDTIAYQKERLTNYFSSEKKLKEELEKLRVLPNVVVRLNDQVQDLERRLEAAQLQQVPIIPPIPGGPITRAEAARRSVSGSTSNVQFPRSTSHNSLGGRGTGGLPHSGSRGSLGSGNARGSNRSSMDGGGASRGRGRSSTDGTNP